MVHAGDDIAPVCDLGVLDALRENVPLRDIIIELGDKVRRTEVKGDGTGPLPADIDQPVPVLDPSDDAR
jgi:hypothetical protein